MNATSAVVSSNNVNIDLSLGQSFEVSVTEKIDEFTILNPVKLNSGTAFTIKFVQPAHSKCGWIGYIQERIFG